MKDFVKRFRAEDKAKAQENSRRNFLRNSALGGLSLGMIFDHDPEKEMEYITQKSEQIE